MIVSLPRFEARKWLIALGFALLGHLSLVVFFAHKNQPISEPLALSAVMLVFDELPQSATKIEPVAIGLPQEVSQPSIASASNTMPDVSGEIPDIKVEKSPQEQAKIVVKKQPKVEKQPKDKTRPKEQVKVELKHKLNKTAEKALNNSPKPTPVREIKEKASEVNAQYSSSTSAPPPGKDSQNTAPSNMLSENRSQTQNWKSKVLGHLMRYQRYPQFALENQIQGTVLTAIRIDKHGNVLEVKIARESGASILDNEALSLAKRASPLPKPPAHLFKSESLVLPIPILFDIKAYKKAKRQFN